MYVTNPQTYNQVAALFDEWGERRTRNSLFGSRKVDEARAEGERMGYDRGVAAGLAVLANQIRVELFGHWKTVPILVESDIQAALLRYALEERQRLDNEVDKIEDATEAAKARKQVRTEWLAWCVDKFQQIAAPKELDEQEFRRHKAAVLAKEEPATEADREWITEEFKKAKAISDQIANLIQS